ncbi:MAG TPA: hypothetical protein VG869_01565, partial [Acidimicrobiia bacterium]|nr:hypothetical protein [Acidimicrobiia bacterium]
DLNGVVVVQHEAAADVLRRLVERAPTDQAYVAEVARGRFSNDWIDRVLLEAGATIPEPER